MTGYNPFHIIPNKGVLHKFVWADGQLRVTPNIAKDPGKMHHGDLLDQMGYNDPRSPLARDIIAGEYYSPFDELDIEYERGEVPDEDTLKQMIEAQILPDRTSSYFFETATLPPKWIQQSPDAVMQGSIPFIYNNGEMLIDPRAQYHSDILSRHIDPDDWDQYYDGTWGRYHPDSNTYRLYDGGPDPKVEQELAKFRNSWSHIYG